MHEFYYPYTHTFTFDYRVYNFVIKSNRIQNNKNNLLGHLLFQFNIED